MKRTEDLTPKQHERKKKQWRKNSAKYYKRKQLDKKIDGLNETDELNQTTDVLNHTPDFPVIGPVVSTPKEGQRLRRSKMMKNLREKLRYAEKKAAEKNKTIQNMKRKINRMEARRQNPVSIRPPTEQCCACIHKWWMVSTGTSLKMNATCPVLFR